MNNSYVHVNMTGELNILIFTTIFLVFHLTSKFDFARFLWNSIFLTQIKIKHFLDIKASLPLPLNYVSNLYTESQPSTSNLTRETLQEECRTANSSLIRLTNMNNSVSLTEFLIRPLWSSVDGNYTPWIAYIGK